MLKIYSDVSKQTVSERLAVGAIVGCGAAVSSLTQKDIDECSVIASQIDAEPFYSATVECPDFDVIPSGRTYDPEPYFAFATSCLKRYNPGYDADRKFREHAEGAIMHMGKLMECGGLCA